MLTVDKEALKTELESRYLKADVRVQAVYKNNTRLMAATILIPGRTAARVIYLDQIKGINNMSIKEIADEVVKINAEDIEDSRTLALAEDIGAKVKNYEYAKPRLHIMLLPLKDNEELLEKCIYEPFLDLAILPYVDIDGIATAKLPASGMKDWNKSREEIIEQAKKNTYEQIVFAPMGEIVQMKAEGTIEMTEADIEYLNATNLYVLTAKNNQSFGAAGITSSEYMDRLANDLGDLYILPSSIHEVLVLPIKRSADKSLEELNAMVDEINTDVLEKEIILQNHAYIYRAGTGWEY